MIEELTDVNTILEVMTDIATAQMKEQDYGMSIGDERLSDLELYTRNNGEIFLLLVQDLRKALQANVQSCQAGAALSQSAQEQVR